MTPPLPLTADQLRLLYHRPWWATLVQTATSLLTYFALISIGYSLDSGPIWIVIWLACGFLLSCFLGASHDCAHGTFLTGRTSNRLFGQFWSSLVLFNFTLYKRYHLEHHQHTAVDGDTEPRGEFGTIWNYLLSLPTQSFFISFWKMSLDATNRIYPHFIRRESDRRAVNVDNWVLGGWVLSAIALTLVIPSFMIHAYWAPLIFYFPMVFLTSLPEHYGCDETDDIWRNTRSIRSNFIFRFYFWNGNFHADHNVYPGIPSWNLPKLHKLIGDRFAFKQRSYILFHLGLIASLVKPRRSTESKLLDPTQRVKFRTYVADNGQLKVPSSQDDSK